jgi:ABC-type bacteriocin/lantibiotic exporter with double-glycine peptidase domain
MLGTKKTLLNSDDAKIACYLLNTIGKRDALILFFIVGILSVIELGGIAIIFPFLQVIIQPDLKNILLMKLGFGFFNSISHEQFILSLGLILILFYAGKTFFQSILLRIQTRKLAKFTELMTNHTIADVLRARYAVFQNTAASRIAGMAYSNTVHSTLALTALIQVANDVILLLLMFIGFFIFNPILAISALLLACITALILNTIVIRRSAILGSAQSQIENVRYRLLFSIASAIRDIKIMGLDNLFDAKNRRISHEYAELAWRFNFNNTLPRLIIEFFALSSVVGTALCIVIFDIPLKESGPLLAVIAIAVSRAIPALSRLFGSISIFRSSSPFVKDLKTLRTELIACAVSRKEDYLSFNDQIELINVGFSYGDKRVLRNVSLKLRQGESIGIVGSSGAGKTTLLDLFTGLQRATEGKFLCDGVSFDPFTSHSIQNIIGYVPQLITLLDETIAFNVSFEDISNKDQVMRVLEMANLKELISSLPEGLETRVGENGLRLSGGQRQRIGIARALYRSPKILVFDEATSSLDTHSETQLTKEIEKLHGQVSSVIVAHRLSTVMACDRIYVLSNGEIESSGTHQELLVKSKTYQKLNAIQREESSEST